MKYLFTLSLILITSTSFAQTTRYQKGYIKKNGTYVQPHNKTKIDNTNRNNYSTTSNYNPYTGTTGSKAKDYSPEAYNYGSGRKIISGERGGQYYKNNRGKKTYVPKRR